MRFSAKTTFGALVGSRFFESLNIVPRGLIRLRIVALLFLFAIKSTYSAMLTTVAGRVGCFLVAHQASALKKTNYEKYLAQVTSGYS